MSPSALLNLWRDRWGKPDISALFLPYRDGALPQKLEAYALSDAWRSATWRWCMRVIACIGVIGVVLVPLNANAQIVLSSLVVAAVVYVRRFASPVLALAIACLALVMSLRYLQWRFGTSLPAPSLTLAFAFGFAWWVAECFSWLCGALTLWSRFWPLERPHQSMPSDASQWPQVDIFIWCDRAALNTVQNQVAEWRKQNWPQNKALIKLLFVQAPDAATEQWARSQQIECVHYPESSAFPWGQVNRQLWDVEGDFVLIVGAATPTVAPLFLQHVMGWMLADNSLGWLHTPTHPLTGTPSKSAQTLQSVHCGDEAQVLVLRRTALLQTLGIGADLSTHMRQTGWDSAHLLTRHTSAPDESTAPTVALIDRPFPSYGLQLRLNLQALGEALQFYRPVWTVFFALTPLVALSLSTPPMQSTLLALSAFFLPHWLLGHLAHAASEHHGRLTFSLLLREHILPLHLLVRTTKSFALTQLQHLRVRMTGGRTPRDPALPAATWARESAWVALNSAVAFAALQRLWGTSHAAYQSALLIFVAWACWNALKSVAALAVAKEARLIARTHEERRRIPAMIQLPGQRPLPGTAINFPEQALEIQLTSSNPSVATGEMLPFSLFHGYHEYPFEGRVTAADLQSVRLLVAPSSADAYHILSAAVFSRDAHWPRWLPGRQADHLIPSRLQAILNILETAFYNLVVQASKPPLMQWLKRWFRPGIKNNG